MTESFRLDTSALMALTVEEPGAERVRELVARAISGGIAVHGCFVSLTELQYIKTYDVGAPVAVQIIADLRRLPIS